MKEEFRRAKNLCSIQSLYCCTRQAWDILADVAKGGMKPVLLEVFKETNYPDTDMSLLTPTMKSKMTAPSEIIFRGDEMGCT